MAQNYMLTPHELDGPKSMVPNWYPMFGGHLYTIPLQANDLPIVAACNRAHKIDCPDVQTMERPLFGDHEDINHEG